MAFNSSWGFDPDEAITAQRLFRGQPETDESADVEKDESGYDAAEERAARIPADVNSQVYELRRIFRL